MVERKAWFLNRQAAGPPIRPHCGIEGCCLTLRGRGLQDIVRKAFPEPLQCTAQLFMLNPPYIDKAFGHAVVRATATG